MTDTAEITSKLSLEEAAGSLRNLLESASLDSVNATSITARLRFISSEVIKDNLIYVDVSFSCDASIRAGEHQQPSPEVNDFFQRRGDFLRAAYLLIGSSIVSAELDHRGRLRMHFTQGVMAELFLSEDDMDDDGSVWEVAAESSADGWT